ncbi:MAG: RDD family protein, partial [Bacilli bacterium]|nr:RDD family protein [Bacilli bacterium]
PDKPLKPTAPVFTRIVAAAIDTLIVVLVSVVGSFLIYRGLIQINPTLKENIDNQTTHVVSSHLAKEVNNSYYSYGTDEYFEQTDDGGYKIIDALSYFYLNYMTNNNLNEGDVGSLEFDKEIDVNGVKVLQKDYYTISWFNENILNLPKEGETASNDYFVYQKDGDNTDYTKVGTVNEKYISKIENNGEITYKVDAPNEMVTFTTNKYKGAIDALYKQQFFKVWTDKLELTSSLITLFTRLFMVGIIFILIPMLLKDGKTLGKLLFKISLTGIDDKPLKKWQILPRALFFVLLPVIMFFVTNSYINIGIIIILLVGSICAMALTKRKTALHDLIARTEVVDDYYKKKIAEQKELEELASEEPILEDEETPSGEPVLKDEETPSEE